MAVGVPDRSEADEATDPETGLLAQLPAGRCVGRFAGFELAARELPEAGQETGRGPTLNEPTAALLEHDDGSPEMRAGRAADPPR